MGAGDPRAWDTHRKRWVTALLLAVPLTGVLVAAPLWSWLLLVLLVAMTGLGEFIVLVFQGQVSFREWIFLMMGGAIPPLGAFLGGAGGLHASLVLLFFLAFCWLLFQRETGLDGLHRMGLTLAGWLYVPYLLSFALLLIKGSHPRIWIFWILFIVVAGDVGAFYCGKTWGSHKLFERVSPKKTWEGALGGLVSGLLIGILYGVILVPQLSLWQCSLLAALVQATGQMGDLVESMIKRSVGKKDASNLLPGHGGLLDRLDSLLFGFPLTWFFLVLCGLM